MYNLAKDKMDKVEPVYILCYSGNKCAKTAISVMKVQDLIQIICLSLRMEQKTVMFRSFCNRVKLGVRKNLLWFTNDDGTGWRATVPFLVLYENGYDNISVYDGGWYEWLMHDDYPVQVGDPASDECVHTTVGELSTGKAAK